MIKPLVSIIIPVYNAEKHLRHCLDAAINQTYQQKEIIIINDGSTDSSLQIAKTFAAENVMIHSQPKKGASAARNFGISIARGTYIQFLDADDFISANKIENQVKLALANKNCIIGCKTIHFFDGTTPDVAQGISTDEIVIFKNEDPIKFMINLWGGYDGEIKMVQPNAWLTPISLIASAGLWNEALTLDDDGEYFCKVVLASDRVIFDRVSTNYYRKYIKSNSVSGGMDSEALRSQANALSSKTHYLLAKTTVLQAKVAVANLYFSLAFISYRKNTSIYNFATKGLKTLDIKPNIKPDLGGKLINFCGALLGWKAARTLSVWKNK